MEIAGKTVQIDPSGVGHAWRAVDKDNCPPDVIDELSAEIINGSRNACTSFFASNGLRYRWQ